jgi:protease-4
VAGLIIAVVGGVVLLFAAVRFASREPDLPSAGWLSLRLSGDLPESAPVSLPLPAFEDRAPLTVAEVWRLLNRAATDSRIKGVLVKPGGLAAGWGKVAEIRSGLEAVRKAGKPVYAWLAAPRTRDYFLATAADRVFLSPEDLLDLKGLRIEAMYFKGTLDKLGVEAEVEHVGRFKDAGDIFTRTGMSPETRESLDAILDELYPRLCAGIAAGRKLEPEAVRRLIDDGPFLAPQARQARLVDELTYERNAEEQLAARARVDHSKAIQARDYLANIAAGEPRKASRVALLVAQGDILRGSVDTFGQEEIISPAQIARLARLIKADKTLKGVIVRIDSPGGDAIASDEILEELKKLSREKPMVISMSDVAASGGYYMAMTGDPVVAYPGTLTGSIGVIYGKANLKGLYDKLGISKDMLKRGRFADIDSDYKPLNPDERKKLRESLEFIYAGFLRRVSDGRRKKIGEIEPLAQGRVWIGAHAKARGLVDDLGGLDKALELLRPKAGIAASEPVRLVPFPGRRSLFDQLMSRSEASTSTDLTILRRFMPTGVAPWVQGGILRVMPYHLDIH